MKQANIIAQLWVSIVYYGYPIYQADSQMTGKDSGYVLLQLSVPTDYNYCVRQTLFQINNF